MKGLLRTAIVYFCAFFTAMASSAMAASFSADMVTTKDGKAETGKYYLSGPYYRMEITEDGKPLVIIVDEEKKEHSILNTETKTYYKVSSENRMLLSKDPFLLSEYIVSKYGKQGKTKENINGIMCEKQEVPSQNYIRWFSKEFGVPIKMLIYEGEKERAVDELKHIKQGDLPKRLFEIPSDFKQKEDPAAAQKRKHEEIKKAEDALPGVKTVGKAQVPCYVKITAGGELHISIDTDREAFLEIRNKVNGDSEYTLMTYIKEKPNEPYDTNNSTLGRNDYRTWDFNDDFDRRSGDSLVNEVVIKVNEGLVNAYMRQGDKDHKDFYNYGNLQNGGEVDPKRSVTVKITGDNPFGPKTTGKFYLSHEDGRKRDVVPFTVENGKTLTWDYPADKGVKGLDVTIKEGDGRAKISVI